MYIEDYISGKYEFQNCFQWFLPTKINQQWEWKTPRLNVLLEKANIELGNLQSYSQLIPNIDLYIKMHIKSEANKSSRIEGIHTTMEEDMLPLEELPPEKRDDVQEVQNYIKALQHGIDRIMLDEFPLSNRLIREIHEKLMQGVRGERKTPGEFRKSQNWIGGSMPSNAMYVPPSHPHIPELMGDLESFIHNEKIYVPYLIRIAMIHYQFESIHPFLDGNGRAGRILISLFLLHAGILSKPCFYISNYFEIHRTQYYDTLNRVRLQNDMMLWIEFFLQASIVTAETARTKFRRAVDLVNEYNRLLPQLAGRSQRVQEVLDAFYEKPSYSVPELAEEIGASKSTISRIISSMAEKGLLEESTGYQRNRVYVMKKYMDVFR